MKITLTEFVTLDGLARDPARRTRTTPNGLLLLEYEVTGQARQGEYEGVTAFT
jgi:hypothetical protein